MFINTVQNFLKLSLLVASGAVAGISAEDSADGINATVARDFAWMQNFGRAPDDQRSTSVASYSLYEMAASRAAELLTDKKLSPYELFDRLESSKNPGALHYFAYNFVYNNREGYADKPLLEDFAKLLLDANTNNPAEDIFPIFRVAPVSLVASWCNSHPDNFFLRTPKDYLNREKVKVAAELLKTGLLDRPVLDLIAKTVPSEKLDTDESYLSFAALVESNLYLRFAGQPLSDLNTWSTDHVDSFLYSTLDVFIPQAYAEVPHYLLHSLIVYAFRSQNPSALEYLATMVQKLADRKLIEEPTAWLLLLPLVDPAANIEQLKLSLKVAAYISQSLPEQSVLRVYLPKLLNLVRPKLSTALKRISSETTEALSAAFETIPQNTVVDLDESDIISQIKLGELLRNSMDGSMSELDAIVANEAQLVPALLMSEMGDDRLLAAYSEGASRDEFFDLYLDVQREYFAEDSPKENIARLGRLTKEDTALRLFIWLDPALERDRNYFDSRPEPENFKVKL